MCILHIKYINIYINMYGRVKLYAVLYFCKVLIHRING